MNSKGQKIIAALYLITSHLPESDPLRLRIRTLALALLETNGEELRAVSGKLTSFIQASVLATLMSENNARIIEAELKYYADPLYHTHEALSSLFPNGVSDKGQLPVKRTSSIAMSFISPRSKPTVSDKNLSNIENKSKRQETIVSFINTRKSANIKDISSLFPEVSEKTIQRELGTLVADGKIKKHGDKRWSIYLSVATA